MNDCKKCKHKGNRCYCSPDKECTAFSKAPIKVKHTFEFETDEDWVPEEPACWVDCPFSFMIRLGEHCRCLDGEVMCPFKSAGLHQNTNGSMSYTAFAYEEDGVTTADLSTYDDKEEAIAFAKSRKWDEVVDDISGRVVWHR